jgi:pimeloyl-ACP methyl ester carboxylesterase
MTEYLERPSGTIAYDDSGNAGPLIVAAPGMGDLRSAYRHLGPLLVAAGYRFAAMDLRGAGESSTNWDDYSDAAIAEDMAALVRHLDGGPAVLIGNSLAAASAVIAAAEQPDLVAGLVLIGPFVRDVPMPAWQRTAFRAMLTPPWGRRAWVSYYRKQMYPLATPPDHADHVDNLGRSLAEPGRFRAFRSLAFNSHADAESCLDGLSLPALVVMGTADPDFPDPQAEARYVADRLDATLLLVDGVGHYPHAEAPERVAPHLIEFLEQHRAA